MKDIPEHPPRKRCNSYDNYHIPRSNSTIINPVVDEFKKFNRVISEKSGSGITLGISF